ncbi:alkane 1-monooxygenase [Citreimonas salinaria]|uniref:Alkane 1-monooxygenase n=1 Tax=Citreimonas salinaria TaxID=321339 RepID=A0A1H3JYY2_9RHOB|nr:alkane 1-monooxygenase [Citreimonas salinaria]SDY44538.1 alkane 1-monooxygenase [Citreimonas salinaria]
MRFAIVTIGVTALVAAGIAWGGAWAALAVASITVFAWALDRIAALSAPDRAGQEFPSGAALSVALGLAHFPILFGAVAALASEGHGTLDKALIFVAASLFIGQVGNANAHELIHRKRRAMRLLGAAVYASILFGHHASAHLRVHHVHAASAGDPNSARLQEGFYSYAVRAWAGSFRAGWRAERRLRGGRGRHPYWGYGAGSVASLTVAAALGGGAGIAALLAIAVYAQAQLLLSDYVQHYGLRRRRREDGRLEPVGPQHSWNAPHGFTSAMMLNAPRHSDHHARPARAYPGLELDREAMPMLPHSLPVMAVIALLPPLWFRVMDKRALAWSPDADPAVPDGAPVAAA